MNNYQSYVEYFKDLCVQHKELEHGEGTGQQVFMLRSWEEVFGKFRTGIKAQAYAFQLIDFTESWTRTGDLRRRNMQCAFVVSHYHSNRNVGEASFIEAKVKALQVAVDFIDRMVYDARNDHELMGNYAFDVEGFNLRPMNNIGDTHYSGWLVSFELNPKVECPFPKASEEAWLDL